MSTYQNCHDDRLEIIPFESNKFLRILFTALFITATFVLPTTGVIKFLFL
jgi:hypothetical protein